MWNADEGCGCLFQWVHSNERQVMLKDLDFDASGLYSCEVSTETPIFTKPSDDQELIIMREYLLANYPDTNFDNKQLSLSLCNDPTTASYLA